jgi:hypothetical protein
MIVRVLAKDLRYQPKTQNHKPNWTCGENEQRLLFHVDCGAGFEIFGV